MKNFRGLNQGTYLPNPLTISHTMLASVIQGQRFDRGQSQESLTFYQFYRPNRPNELFVLRHRNYQSNPHVFDRNYILSGMFVREILILDT